MTQDNKKLENKEMGLMKHNVFAACFVLVTVLVSMPAYAQPLVIVFGLDETGSYDFRKKAISLVSGIIAGLEPGDIFYARRVT